MGDASSVGPVDGWGGQSVKGGPPRDRRAVRERRSPSDGGRVPLTEEGAEWRQQIYKRAERHIELEGRDQLMGELDVIRRQSGRGGVRLTEDP